MISTSKSINLIFIALLVSCFAFVGVSSAKNPRNILPKLSLSNSELGLAKQAVTSVLHEAPMEVSSLDYLDVQAPEYPKLAREKGWEGTVVLKVLVSEEGNPADIAVEKSTGHEALDQAALEAVSSWKFHPAYYENNPYPSMVLVPVKFALSDTE